jgi:hypothetical protein
MSEEANILSAFLGFPQFSAQAADIGDSEKRLIALQQASLDLAVAVADVTYLAFNGQLPIAPGLWTRFEQSRCCIQPFIF